MESSTHYFGAGPAALPLEVKQQIQSNIVRFTESDISILELSHRSEEFALILDSARNLLRNLYSIPSNYHILFMQGGATAQFDAVPLNLLGTAKHMTYIDTGFWSRKAADLAKKYAEVTLLNGLAEADGKICCIDTDQWNVSNDSAYVHITPNETIDGIELRSIKEMSIPLVADMTSCLLMRPFDISQYGLIYAGTQKTLGIAGLTVVIVRDDLLQQVSEQTPHLYRYDIHVREKSLVNTTPVFACYVTQLMLDWVNKNGGVKSMATQAQRRAELLYSAIDENPNIVNNICVANRSSVNVVFDFLHPQALQTFLAATNERGLLGLAGHRLVGGVRASMYNGTPMAAVENLYELMRAS